jgi:uncharacterized protein YbjT (DUF2867 family)
MRILVTGANGAVGSLLVPRLLAEGHEVRGLVRRPPPEPRLGLEAKPPSAGDRPARPLGEAAGHGAGGAEVLVGDALTGAGLRAALEGVEVAYYLIHSMQRATAGEIQASFPERERLAAENFAAATAAAGVRRIVYLGGPVVPGRTPSRHLASRMAVEDILRGVLSDVMTLRASIVVGARSRSFRFMVRLIERMPVLALPGWRSYRTRPIDARDITTMLAACATGPARGRALNVGGPDVLTYQQMIARICELMLVDRPIVALGQSVGSLTARFAAAIAGEDPELITALMESLEGDLLPEDEGAAELLNVRLHSFDSAVEHALREWERLEPLAAR